MVAKQTTIPHSIDFATFIEERTRHFTGRAWLEDAVDVWLKDAAAPMFFLLTGDPGVGKSAFSAHLVRSRPRQISAYHFCSARQGGWIDPLGFVRSMAAQLALRWSGSEFASELLMQEGVHVKATQTIGHLVGGTAVNVFIGNLEVFDAEDGFNRLIRGPLQRLAESGWDEQIVLLVDGLDEALAYTGSCNIVELLARARDLPRFVRILLTSRSEHRVLRHWDDIPHFRIDAGCVLNLGDIRDYVDLRMRCLVAQERQTSLEQGLVERIVDKSAGNFLYVAYLMDTFERHPDTRSFEELPDGLDGVYRLFLNSRDTGKDLHRWEDRYLPVIGVLAVAREPLNEDLIARFTGHDRQQIAMVVCDLWQYLSQEPGEKPSYRIYHQSFLDFLTNRDRAQNHWVDAQTWHEKIVKAYYGGTPGSQSLPPEPDGYALRHLTAHLEASGFAIALFHLVEDNDWYKRKLALDASGASYATDVEHAVMAAARLGSVVDLITYALLFATVTEPFTEELVDQLVKRVEQGQLREALETTHLIARPAHRAQALLAIGSVLSKTGQCEEARQVWQEALAALRQEGNPVRAVEVASNFCAELFEQGEEVLAEETLDFSMSEIRRIPGDESRFSRWGALAEKLSGLTHTEPAMRILDALISDAAGIKHHVIYRNLEYHDDSAYQCYDGIEEKCNSVELAAWFIPRISDASWCEDALRRLDRIIETIPTSEYWRAIPPSPDRSSQADSRMRAKMRELIAAAKRKITEPVPSVTEDRLPLYYSCQSYGTSVSPWYIESRRQEALTRLEKTGVVSSCTIKTVPIPTPLERASAKLTELGKEFQQVRALLSRVKPHSDPSKLDLCCRELESLARAHASYHSPPSDELDLLVTLGDYEGALRLLNSLDSYTNNNEACAKWLLAMAWRAVEYGRVLGERVLERIVEHAGQLRTIEQKSRVFAGAARALDELGFSTRAWDCVAGIEYQNIRIDAAITLLFSAVTRGNREITAEGGRRLAAILRTTWAEGESARGWLALLAWAAWAGDDKLQEEYTGALNRVLHTTERLEHAAYQSFLFFDGYREPSWGDAGWSERLQVENAFGILITQEHAPQALELFARLHGLIDSCLALRVMGVAVLEKQNVAGYRQVLRLDAGQFELERARYHGGGEYKLATPPPLPENPDTASALCWLKTAFLAARFEGRYEVWRHVFEMAPLLAFFPDVTVQGLRERLLAIEKLHQESAVQEAFP